MSTVPGFTEITDEALITDEFYMIRGLGTDRDRRMKANKVLPIGLNVSLTGTLDLSLYFSDMVVFIDNTGVTLTITNTLPAGRSLIVINNTASNTNIAGIKTATIPAGEKALFYADDTAMVYIASDVTDQTLTVNDTAAIDLSLYVGNLVIFADKATAFTITFSNYLGAGKQIQIVGVGVGLVTLAGTITDSVLQNEVRLWLSSASVFYSGNPNGTVRTKIINIGDWNMLTTDVIGVPHGIADFKNIRPISANIRSDNDGKYNPLSKYTSTGLHGGIDGYDVTIINLRRLIGGFFDHVDYSTTSYNRGWITLTYEV